MSVLDADATTQYWLTRFCFQRALGFVYLVAFLVAANQLRPLVGERGLLPARLFLPRVRFWDAPGVFWLNSSDAAMAVVSWTGVALSVAALTGLSDRYGFAVSMGTWGLLWVLYLSIVGVGQVFYGFGWESLLLETGFLAIFLGPSRSVPPVLVIWLVRWVLFRVMFGAGMIKLRGDPCWRDLTCMQFHYETQPLPNPVSWYLHRLPPWLHRGSVLFTHFVELVVPWGYFWPRLLRHAAGALTVLFQGTLIVSGNLSWLNYLTIVLSIACFDDTLLSRIVPLETPQALERFPEHQWAAVALAGVVAVLSVRPARNLFSRRQLMNASFDRLHLVNTYGAFGSVTRERMEIVLEGTDDPTGGPQAAWREYEFKCKPGDPSRRPCVVAPYHRRLDWQIWFAAMTGPERHPWLLNLVAKLLAGDRAALSLMASNPFPDAPPKRIRARLYRYRFTRPGDGSAAWWTRTLAREYLPPLSLDEPAFRSLLRRNGWLSGESTGTGPSPPS